MYSLSVFGITLSLTYMLLYIYLYSSCWQSIHWQSDILRSPYRYNFSSLFSFSFFFFLVFQSKWWAKPRVSLSRHNEPYSVQLASTGTSTVKAFETHKVQKCFENSLKCPMLMYLYIYTIILSSNQRYIRYEGLWLFIYFIFQVSRPT